jgi:hypothetical protein
MALNFLCWVYHLQVLVFSSKFSLSKRFYQDGEKQQTNIWYITKKSLQMPNSSKVNEFVCGITHENQIFFDGRLNPKPDDNMDLQAIIASIPLVGL